MKRARKGGIKADVPDVVIIPDAVESPAREVGGRPTVKTPENREKILAEVRTGTPKTCAAVFCGIGRSTFHEWEKEDPDFCDALEAAEQVYYKTLREKVEAGRMLNGDADWRASFALLERRDRKHYGKAEEKTASVTVNATANLTIVLSESERAGFQQREKQALEALLSGRN